MTLHQLRIFDVVSRHLNITKASEELRISQPSVFQQIKSLEESCGIRLYRKVGRGIELTAAGEKMQAEAQEILDKVEALQRKFRADSNSILTGALMVGGAHVPSKSVLPICLAAFKQNHPHVQVTLQTRTSRTIERQVLNSVLELAIINHSSRYPELNYIPFRQEEVVLFVRAQHPLARKEELSLADIAAAPLVVHRGLHRGSDATTLQILKFLEARASKPNILMECNSGEAVKVAVLSGTSVGILMRAYLDDEIRRREVKVLRIPGGKKLSIASFVVYKKDKTLSDNAREFLEVLKRSPYMDRPARQSAVHAPTFESI